MVWVDGTSNEPTSTYRPDRLFKTEVRILEHLQERRKIYEPSRSSRSKLHKVSGSRGKTDAGFLLRLTHANYIVENSFGIYITGLGEEALYNYHTKRS